MRMLEEPMLLSNVWHFFWYQWSDQDSCNNLELVAPKKKKTITFLIVIDLYSEVKTITFLRSISSRPQHIPIQSAIRRSNSETISRTRYDSPLYWSLTLEALLLLDKVIE